MDLYCNIFNSKNNNIDQTYLQHTLWLLPSIDSCYVLEKILKEDEHFKHYKILNVNEKKYGSGVSIVNKVKEQIKEVRKKIKEQ